MAPPLEEDVRGVKNADGNGAAEATPKAEPEGGKDYGEVVETLKDIVKVVKVERRKVVQEADSRVWQQIYGDPSGVDLMAEQSACNFRAMLSATSGTSVCMPVAISLSGATP